MAFKSVVQDVKNILPELGNSVDGAYNQIKGYVGSVQKIDPINYADLLEKFSNFKIAVTGNLVLDHVTFYIDLPKRTSLKEQFQARTKTFRYFNENTDYYKSKKINKAFKDDVAFVTLDNVFINVTRTKNIVKTIIPNYDSTIKEFVSNGDYEITFNGILAGNNEWQTDVTTLIKLDALFSLKQEIMVDSIYLNNYFGFNSIAINDYSFANDTEYSNLETFTINASSDDTSQYAFAEVKADDEPISDFNDVFDRYKNRNQIL